MIITHPSGSLLHADSHNEVGAENWAMLASLVATSKMAGVNPVDYLATTLRAILDGHPQSGIEDLMPWRYAQLSSLAA